jgi:hypothetical protein
MMPRWKYRGSISINTDVDVDISDVMEELSNEELLEECTLRSIVTGQAVAVRSEEWRDFAEQMRTSISNNDALHVEVLIVRMLAMAGVPRLSIPAKKPEAA